MELPGESRGTASILEDTAQRVTVAANMATPGLIVLSDRWDPGWKAYLDGKQVPIVCANHAMRGVVVPAGQKKLQFRYEPPTLFWGSMLSGVAIVLWLVWAALVALVQRRRPQPAATIRLRRMKWQKSRKKQSWPPLLPVGQALRTKVAKRPGRRESAEFGKECTGENCLSAVPTAARPRFPRPQCSTAQPVRHYPSCTSCAVRAARVAAGITAKDDRHREDQHR